jgi:hypothetical protein
MTAVLERPRMVCDATRMSVLPIEEVLRYQSIDNVYVDCRCGRYDMWCECVECGPVHEILDSKRGDVGYEALVNSIRTRGMFKGIRIHPTLNRVTDGHHRIAACVDLGFKFIPVESHVSCEDDSGRVTYYWREQDIL